MSKNARRKCDRFDSRRTVFSLTRPRLVPARLSSSASRRAVSIAVRRMRTILLDDVQQPKTGLYSCQRIHRAPCCENLAVSGPGSLRRLAADEASGIRSAAWWAFDAERISAGQQARIPVTELAR